MGGAVGKVEAALGAAPMPWQQYVNDVAMEIDPSTGQLYYSEVIYLTPRQSGKTTKILGVMVHRAVSGAFMTPRQSIVYTAQTFGAARKKFIDEHVPIIRASPFDRLIEKLREGNDAPALYYRNGSRHGIEAGTKTSAHGGSNDLTVIDEAFAEEDARKEQALLPSMATRKGAQLWIPSTAGDSTSFYLRSKVDAGRNAILEGRPTRTAFFEWSAPDDADPDDPAVWRACMPALGHTIDEAFIASSRETMLADPKQGDDGFRRAFLNQWRDGVQPDQVISGDVWAQRGDGESRPPVDAPRVVAVNINPQGTSASIGIAAHRSDGRIHVQVVESRPGSGWAWVVPRLQQMRSQRRVALPVILAGSGAAAIIDDCDELDIDTRQMSAGEMAAACSQFVGKVGDLVHIVQPELNAALAGASKRVTGTSWVWDQRAAVDVTPLIAVTAARWGLVRPDLDTGDHDIEQEFPDV